MYRESELVYRSKEQTHFFNCPFQLGTRTSSCTVITIAIVNVTVISLTVVTIIIVSTAYQVPTAAICPNTRPARGCSCSALTWW